MSPSLSVADFSFNQISQISSLSFQNLKEFDISYNPLRGTLPEITAPILESLKLSYTNLEGPFDISKFPVLDTIDVSSTYITISAKTPPRELIVSSSSQFPNGSPKLITSSPFLGYSEMCGSRPRMEDSIVLIQMQDFGNATIACVFDGHGGALTATASSQALPRLLAQEQFSPEGLKNALGKLNDEINQKHLQDGCTCALAAVSGDKLLFANIGDSRAVLINEKDGARKATLDQKPTDRTEFERILNIGGKVIQGRTDGILGVARSIGDPMFFCAEALPEITQIKLEQDDRWIVICCDGVFDVVDNDELLSIIRTSEMDEPNSIAHNIRDVAFGRFSGDNISALVIDLKKM